jgi:pimeloyl-ACP methyl ester carboxylesterase
VLNQLASWGFVVIASTSSSTGRGTEMLSAVDYLVARDAESTGVFAGKLDPTRIAAAGHSQGAGGAARATLASAGRITTVVPINPPDPAWVGEADRFDFSRLSVPVLLLSGVNDTWISPPRTLTAYYDQIPGAAVRASLQGADHNTIQQSGGRYLGYLTAWLRYQLVGDQVAELITNQAWFNQAAKGLV